MHYYCTLFDKNYILKGLALHQSLERHAKPYWLYILCLDPDTHVLLGMMMLPNVILVPINLLEAEMNLHNVKANRSWLEYYWTLASQLMWYLMNLLGCQYLTYLDADIFFFSSPEVIYDEMGSSSIAIVPHRFYTGNARLLVNRLVASSCG